MSYETWQLVYNGTMALVLLGPLAVGVIFLLLVRRPPNAEGERKLRPILAVMIAITTFFVLGPLQYALFSQAYPAYSARQDQEWAQQQGRLDSGDQADSPAGTEAEHAESAEADRQANMQACMDACPDAPSRCGVFNVERCEERQSEMNTCVSRCGYRFGRR